MEPAQEAIKHILIGVDLMVWLGSLAKQSQYNEIFDDIQFSKTLIKYNGKPQLIWTCLDDKKKEKVMVYYLYHVRDTDKK